MAQLLYHIRQGVLGGPPCRKRQMSCALVLVFTRVFYLHPRDALEGKGSQRWPRERLDRRLGEVAKAVGRGYCRLQMP